jgi:hypothetical protein
MVVLAAAALDWIPNQPVLVGVLTVGYVVPSQFLATVMIFLARDTVSATAFGLFAANWLASGLIERRGAGA